MAALSPLLCACYTLFIKPHVLALASLSPFTCAWPSVALSSTPSQGMQRVLFQSPRALTLSPNPESGEPCSCCFTSLGALFPLVPKYGSLVPTGPEPRSLVLHRLCPKLSNVQPCSPSLPMGLCPPHLCVARSRCISGLPPQAGNLGAPGRYQPYSDVLILALCLVLSGSDPCYVFDSWGPCWRIIQGPKEDAYHIMTSSE